MRVARPALPIVTVLIALAALAVGCGSSNDSGTRAGSAQGAGESSAAAPTAPAGASAQSCKGAVAGAGQLRVTGVGCDVGRGVVAGWVNKPSCSRPAGASRYSCAVHGKYRCQGAATERGIAVSCARQGSSLAFVAKRD